MDIKRITYKFFELFEKGDIFSMEPLLSPHIKSYITNQQGGVDLLEGVEPLLNNLHQMDTKTIKPVIHVTQMALVQEQQLLLMVEIKAERKAKKLHNFAAFLLSFDADKISEIRMVEALPAYSEEFWRK